MLDFRDKKRSPNNRTAPGKKRECRAIQRLRERKKESAGERGLDSSPGTLLLLDR